MATGDIAYRESFVIERGATLRVGFSTSLAGNRATGITWGKTSTVEISKDGGAFVATTNSPVEVNDSGASACGFHYLSLTATELTADLVWLKIIPDPTEADEVHLFLHTVGNDNASGNIRNIAADVRLIRGSTAATGATGYIAADSRRVDGIALASHTAGYYPVVSGGVPSAADVADAVLDELLSGHTTAGSLGQAITDILEDSGTSIPALIAALPSSAGIADAVLDEALSAHTTSGSAGEALGNLSGATTAQLKALLTVILGNTS